MTSAIECDLYVLSLWIIFKLNNSKLNLLGEAIEGGFSLAGVLNLLIMMSKTSYFWIPFLSV